MGPVWAKAIWVVWQAWRCVGGSLVRMIQQDVIDGGYRERCTTSPRSLTLPLDSSTIALGGVMEDG
jgi:hypothetical protein